MWEGRAGWGGRRREGGEGGMWGRCGRWRIRGIRAGSAVDLGWFGRGSVIDSIWGGSGVDRGEGGSAVVSVSVSVLFSRARQPKHHLPKSLRHNRPNNNMMHFRQINNSRHEQALHGQRPKRMRSDLRRVGVHTNNNARSSSESSSLSLGSRRNFFKDWASCTCAP